MNNFKLALRSLLRKGRGNIIKILSLGLGLAVGIILITKVFFEYNYESFYPDAERIYRVVVDLTYGQGDAREEYKGRNMIPGGVVYTMGEEIPVIEAATRFTFIEGGKLRNPSREVVDAVVILADSCFYDVLPRPMIDGDAKIALSTPHGAILSRSMAQKLGVEMGETVEFDEYPGRSVIIEGIFEDIPENSDFEYDMAISMLSIGDFMWDGSLKWVGNDRYNGFVKLRQGVTAAETIPQMREVQLRHGHVEELKAAGVELVYRLRPLLSGHREDPEVRRSNLMMIILAVSLIVIALLNYLIITLSTLLKRGKEIAVYKCYGAGGREIRRQVLTETALHIALSVVTAAVLVGLFRVQVEEILRTSLISLFSWQSIAIVVGVCLLLLAIATWVPSRLFVSVPAASVFRNFKKLRKGWKLALLAVQFAAAAAFVAILAVIWRQYTMMVTSDPGYKYENVLFANVAGTSQSERGVAISGLEAISGVEMVSSSAYPLFEWANGDNVSLPGDDRERFNIADLYEGSFNYFDMLEVPIIEGSGFKKGVSVPTDIIVSRDFAELISTIADWNDGVVGKQVYITGHSEQEFTIRGVFENIRIGSITQLDSRPAALFYTNSYSDYIWIRLREVNGESMRAVQNILSQAMPDKQINVRAMKNTIVGLYNNERLERNSIVLCSVITLLIVLIGLVGYLRNEISRRSAEIAIRKINGADTRDVLRLLSTEILYIAVLSLVAGSLVAYSVSRYWLSGFPEQIALTPWLYLATTLVVLCVIVAVTVAVSYRISIQNPVDSLKKDE
jgi:putative ABC transport system permease protein